MGTCPPPADPPIAPKSGEASMEPQGTKRALGTLSADSHAASYRKVDDGEDAPEKGTCK